MRGVDAELGPPAFNIFLVGLAEAGGHPHTLWAPGGALPIAALVERGEHLGAEATSLRQDGFSCFQRKISVSGQARELPGIEQVLEHEAQFGDGGAVHVGHLRSRSPLEL